MTKPILEPGRPGDLVVILDTALAQLQELQEKYPNDLAVVYGTAIATYEALSMWLGLTPTAKELQND
jgi:hypothetical protein